MQARYPCPNERCDHWNPLDRAACYRCQEDLSGVDPKVARSAQRSGTGPRILIGILALIVIAGVFGFWQMRQRAALADQEAPTIELDEPAELDLWVSGSSLRIAGRVLDEHPDRVDAGGESVPVEDGRFSMDVPVPGEGGEIAVVAYDVAGNASIARRLRVTVDREAATIDALTPADGSRVATRNASVQGTASEELAAARVGGTEAVVDGMSFRAEVTLDEGPNELPVVVRDLAGNETTSALTVIFEERRLPAGFDSTGRTSGGQEVFTAAKDGARLVLLPEGSFVMGSEDGDGDERPTHEVALPSFFIQETPVTNAQYAAFVEATGRQSPPAPPWERDPAANAPSAPVVNVTWQDARAYAEWAGRRLVTEAEWEYAARGPRSLVYPWGNDAPADGSLANLEGDADGHENVAPVGAFPAGASPFGVLGMAGNVWEWTADWYASNWYGRSPGDDPEGPSSGRERVVRGGSFISAAQDARAANRWRQPPANRERYLGFRTAVDFPSD